MLASGATSISLLSLPSTLAFSSLAFMFDTFRFVAADFTSGVEVFDSCDGSFESDFFVGFFEVELPLMDVTASFGLLEEGAGRGLSHEMLPSEGLSVTAVGTLRRPSFGDLARVGGICYKIIRSVVQFLF